MMAAAQKTKSYSVRVVEEGRNIAVILPDRYYQFQSEIFVKIGPTVYFYDFLGKVIVRNQPTPFFDRVNLNNLRDQIIQVKQASVLPNLTIDNLPCIGYQTSIVVPHAQPPKTPGPTPQIVNVNQPVKVYFTAKDGYVKQMSFGDPNPLTLIFDEFNEDFVINPLQ